MTVDATESREKTVGVVGAGPIGQRSVVREKTGVYVPLEQRGPETSGVEDITPGAGTPDALLYDPDAEHNYEESTETWVGKLAQVELRIDGRPNGSCSSNATTRRRVAPDDRTRNSVIP